MNSFSTKSSSEIITNPIISILYCRHYGGLDPIQLAHDDVIKWKHFPGYWPFVRGIHRPLVNSRTKANDAELWCFRWSAPEINGWVNNREAGDLRRHRAHYDVTVMDFVHNQNAMKMYFPVVIRFLVIKSSCHVKNFMTLTFLKFN